MDFFVATFSSMRTVFPIARTGALLVLLFSALVGFGHLTGLDTVYWPLPAEPATHPTTALMTASLAMGLLLMSPVRKIGSAARGLFLFAIVLAAARSVEILSLVPPDAAVGQVPESAPRGNAHGETGINTLVTGLLIAGGQLLRSRTPRVALVVAAMAPTLPVIAVLGYALHQHHFHGEMSLVSVALLLPLCLVGLMSFVRRPALRPFLSDTYAGRSARVEILAGLGFPLVIGAVLVQRHPDVASDTAIQSVLMALFAATVVIVKTRNHAATEHQRQRSVQALKAAAVTDHLTGLANRHGATMQMDAAATARPVGVILADLDKFKRINDVWGHAAGDQVLIDAARVFRTRLRSGQIVARWGGEEFLVVLPGYDLDRTRAVAEELRAGLAAVRGPGGALGEITASFGVSERFARETSLEGAMYRADAALYNAKSLGRDRVVQDACAGCSGVSTAAFRRDLIPSDQGAMGCGCTVGGINRLESASTASIPGPGSLN